MRAMHLPTCASTQPITLSDVTNLPGVLGKGVASFVKIKRNDGLTAILAHIEHLSSAPALDIGSSLFSHLFTATSFIAMVVNITHCSLSR